jgi:hypothetical protein
VKLSGGDKLEAKLRELAAKVAGGGIVRIGFLEGSTYPDGTSVPMIAALQNFGSPANNIPPRPFFSNMIAAKSPGWGDSFERILNANGMDVRKSLALMGAGIAGQLRVSINETNTPPLSPVTIARKGFAKPLIDSGVMFQSVDFEVVAT